MGCTSGPIKHKKIEWYLVLYLSWAADESAAPDRLFDLIPFSPCFLFWSSGWDQPVAQAMVCTPGRLIDLIKMKGCTLRRTTYIVFDEADRMFDMGFEPQVPTSLQPLEPELRIIGKQRGNEEEEGIKIVTLKQENINKAERNAWGWRGGGGGLMCRSLINCPLIKILSSKKGAATLQVRSIIGQIRPDRQTLLFSATMPTKVERLVRDALTSPVRVSVGEIGAANEDIKQVELNVVAVISMKDAIWRFLKN